MKWSASLSITGVNGEVASKPPSGGFLLPGVFVERQGAFPLHRMVDDRGRIVDADPDLECPLSLCGEQPRGVDFLVAAGGQFRNVFADEPALWIEFFRLGDRIEDAEPGLGIAACGGG